MIQKKNRLAAKLGRPWVRLPGFLILAGWSALLLILTQLVSIRNNFGMFDILKEKYIELQTI
jgi:hypothetical protein